MKNQAVYYDTIKSWIESCKTFDQLGISVEAIELLYINNFGADSFSARLYELATEKQESIQVEGIDIYDNKNMD